MLTGFLRARAPARTDRPHCSEERLRRLLHAGALRPHRFSSQCEIGPFIVAHVCRERSLVVELLAQPDLQGRQQQRAAFLGGLGYTVLHIRPRDLQRQPRQVLRQIAAALRDRAGAASGGTV
jgi:very-short-patch-repair endonuclease